VTTASWSSGTTPPCVATATASRAPTPSNSLRWPLVSRARLEREIAECKAAFEWEIAEADRRVEQAELQMGVLRKQVGDAIGLQVGRPTPEGLPGGVNFPVHVSGFVLRELDKRMGYELLATIVGLETQTRVLDILKAPGPRVLP
jgi:hypothetical protein